jgi:hypothetical protein
MALSIRGHLAQFAGRHVTEDVAVKMHHAALPARLGEVLGGTLHQAHAGIGHDQLDTLQSTAACILWHETAALTSMPCGTPTTTAICCQTRPAWCRAPLTLYNRANRLSTGPQQGRNDRASCQEDLQLFTLRHGGLLRPSPKGCAGAPTIAWLPNRKPAMPDSILLGPDSTPCRGARSLAASAGATESDA